MEHSTPLKTFNRRSFISISMFMAGICLPFSGLMNHRLQLVGMTAERHFWMSVHNSAAILFLIMAIIHIIYNRRMLMKYLKAAGHIAISREALAAIALVVILVGLFSMHAFHV